MALWVSGLLECSDAGDVEAARQLWGIVIQGLTKAFGAQHDKTKFATWRLQRLG